MDIGPSESELFWTEFLRKRGLRGVKLVISNAHEGLKAAISKVLRATWQRCRVRFMSNTLAHVGRSGRVRCRTRTGGGSAARLLTVSAFFATAFAQNDAEPAKHQCRRVADQFRRSCRSSPRSWSERSEAIGPRDTGERRAGRPT